MPTQKFLNLSIRKQRMILESMRDQFLLRPYAEITVSGLIREAGISRASFYTYFDGKEDMFSCMLKTMAEDAQEILADSFRENNGIFCRSLERIFILLTENDVGRMYSQVCQHILEDEGCRPAFIQVEQEYYRAGRWKDRGKTCFEALDRALYPALDEEGLACAVDMGMSIIYKAVMLYFDRCSELRKLEEAVRMQLHILEQGIRAQGPDRKEDDRDEKK